MDDSVNRQENVTKNNTDSTECIQNQDIKCTETVKTNVSAHTGHDVIECSDIARLEKRRNLPGFHTTFVDMGDQHMEPPKSKKIKLSPGHCSSSLHEALDNTEIGKRKRVQHDYRRLSSSGYLDDYETSRERRFSSDSETTSPGLIKPKTSSGVQTENADQEDTPHVKLTLKLSKTENGTFINNGSGKFICIL